MFTAASRRDRQKCFHRSQHQPLQFRSDLQQTRIRIKESGERKELRKKATIDKRTWTRVNQAGHDTEGGCGLGLRRSSTATHLSHRRWPRPRPVGHSRRSEPALTSHRPRFRASLSRPQTAPALLPSQADLRARAAARAPSSSRCEPPSPTRPLRVWLPLLQAAPATRLRAPPPRPQLALTACLSHHLHHRGSSRRPRAGLESPGLANSAAVASPPRPRLSRPPQVALPARLCRCTPSRRSASALLCRQAAASAMVGPEPPSRWPRLASSHAAAAATVP